MRIAVVILIVMLAACTAEPRVPVSLAGHDLVRDGGEVLFAAVGPGEAESAASVRRAHSVEHARDGSLAGALLSINRDYLLVLIRRRGGGELEFSCGLTVPAATEVVFRPGGGGVLLASTRDLYLPGGAAFKLNRGVMVVACPGLSWFGDLQASLSPDVRDRRWYDRPGERYVSEQDFELGGTCWTPDGCEVLLVEKTGREVRLDLHEQ